VTKGKRHKALVDFLVDAFDAPGLAQFLKFSDYDEIANAVNPNVGQARYCFEVVQALDRVGRINADLFDRLSQERPARREEIESLKELVLGGSHSTSPDSGPPFFVLFPRNNDFVGRAEDLESLHRILQQREPVGIRPAGLTGMGGIGKTQLAVEYVYKYKAHYPGGIFWINAAEVLAQGFAEIGTRLRPETLDQSPTNQLRAAFELLGRRPDALLVFDNLDEPAQLDRSIGREPSPSTLPSRILFTTRRRDLGRFQPIELSVLPEEPALKLLLYHRSRHPIRESRHPEHAEARIICRRLGWLPLALELAGAFLGKRSTVSLTDYRKRLDAEGCLNTIDPDAKPLPKSYFQPTHEAAVAATLRSQWDALTDDEDEQAKRLFRVAGQFTEAAVLPAKTLGLFAGLDHAAPAGHSSELELALDRLHDVRLIEELREDRVRLHPLVREFAKALTPKDETTEFRHACARRVVDAFDSISAWEDLTLSNGIDGLQQSLTAARDFASPQADDGIHQTLSSWLRMVRRESHSLRTWDLQQQPGAFARQIQFRAVTFGTMSLAEKAEQRLTELPGPHILLRWRTLNESPALIRILSGHQGPVTSVAVSPDGRRIVSGSGDNTVAVWDLEAGTLIHQLSGHQRSVSSVAVGPDGRRIVSGSWDKTVAVWDLEAGTLIHRLSGHQDWVTSVAVSPDGRRIVSGSWDKTVAVWDLKAGTLIHQLSGHQDKVTSVAVSPDGQLIVSGSLDRTVAVWDLEAGTLIHQLSGHQDSVYSVAVTPDGRRIISGSVDHTVAVWDLEAGALLHQLSAHRSFVNSVAVSPDGRRIVSGSNDNTVAVWDLEAGTLIHQLSGHQYSVTSVAVSPDGRRVASGSYDNTVAVWDVEAGTFIHQLSGHQSSVTSVAVSPDGRRVASGSYDDTVAVWDVEAGTLIHRLWGHKHWVTSVAVSPDGRRIVSGSHDHTVAVWNLEAGTLIHQLSGHQDSVTSVAVSPDGRRIVSGSWDKTVAVWDLEAGTLIQQLPGHQRSVNSVAVSPDGRRIVCAYYDKTVAIWDLEAGTLIHQLSGHHELVTSMAVSPDGRRIVSGSHDHTVAVWDLEAGTLIRQLSGHQDKVTSVAVSPDGRRIVSGSDDKTVAVWDLEAGRCLTSLTLDGDILTVTWHPDSRFVIAGDGGGNLYRLEYREP
jgi:WD40 repeat protein